MRNTVFFVTLVLLLVIFNGLVVQKEELLKSDSRIYLELAPVDPRSLMQGDYMRLRYAIEGEVYADGIKQSSIVGKMVVQLDENRAAHFVRFDDETPIDENQMKLKYSRLGGMMGSSVKVAPESYMFQEGHAKEYSNARYAELVVGGDGKCLLYGLRDESFNLLGKNKR